jgi:hypothetical protein
MQLSNYFENGDLDTEALSLLRLAHTPLLNGTMVAFLTSMKVGGCGRNSRRRTRHDTLGRFKDTKEMKVMSNSYEERIGGRQMSRFRKAASFICLPLVAGVALALAGCSSTGTSEDENFIVTPGKADDYYSKSAQEYVVEGTSTVTLESYYEGMDEEQRMERAKELIGYKHVVVEWFLNAYLIDKSSHNDNEDYGGFNSMVKAGAYEDLEITHVEGETYSFKFQMIVGGTTDLLDLLPTEDAGDGKRRFTLQMGKISNSEMERLEINREWYRSSPWSSFDPSEMDPEDLEPIVLTIWPEERSVDAWIDYQELFADGVVTISVHFGWDYHSEYHLKHSERLYEWLVSMGFTSPVASYDEYTRTSGPLVKEYTANGREVRAEVSLYWGKPGTETDPDTDQGGVLLENDMREALATKEVVIYSGHSGYLYGFALANWRMTSEGDLDDSEVPFLDMPSDVYQLVVAEGCDTYAMGQAFWENPNKEGHENLDVITTTSFSNASSPAVVQDIISALVPSWGDHEPVTFGDLLADLDRNSYWFNTLYGVHGIDDNPKMHPYADVSALCQPCSQSADCPAPGNQCTRLSESEKVCTAFCTDDSGCPEGYMCLESARNDGYIHSKQCVPTSLSCENRDPEPAGPTIIINEVHADPAPSLEGDANGDGVRSYKEDEFVELVNAGEQPVDISGFTLSDGLRVRFTFPEGTVLNPGKGVVVFGGGDPSQIMIETSAPIFVASGGLALTNTGDTVVVADARGNELDSMTYGDGECEDRALTRAVDGDPEASFVPHTNTRFSPGLEQDGSPF